MYTFLDTLRQALIIIFFSIQCFCICFKAFWKVCFDEAVSESLASPLHRALLPIVKTVT